MYSSFYGLENLKRKYINLYTYINGHLLLRRLSLCALWWYMSYLWQTCFIIVCLYTLNKVGSQPSRSYGISNKAQQWSVKWYGVKYISRGRIKSRSCCLQRCKRRPRSQLWNPFIITQHCSLIYAFSLSL